MSIQSIFFKRVSVLATLLVCVAVTNAQEIMPLSEIKPGMKGYGFSVFDARGRQKFEFKVKGLYADGHNLFPVVILSGGPKDSEGRRFVEFGQVFRGMSGSPVYIDGKIIGALSKSWLWQKTPQTRITPIELMINFGRNSILEPNKFLQNSATSQPTRRISKERIVGGDLFNACEVWDEKNYCVGYSGHATFVDPGNSDIFYALGHPAFSSSSSAVVGIPFWRARPITMVAGLETSQIYADKSGPMLGSIILDGPFGQIGRLGAIPKFFTASVNIKDNKFGNAKFNYFFAYTARTSSHISEIIRKRSSSIDNERDVSESCSILLNNPPVEIYYESAIEKTLELGSEGRVLSPSIGPILGKLITEDLKPVIDRVRLTLRAVPRYKILKLKEILPEAKVIGEDGRYSYLGLIVLGEKEWRTNIVFDNKYRGKALSISRGKEIAKKILFDGPSFDSRSAELLSKISDWNAAYLYYERENNVTLVDEGSFGVGTWQARPSTKIEILAQIKPPGSEYILEGELNFIVNPIQPEKEKNGKN